MTTIYSLDRYRTARGKLHQAAIARSAIPPVTPSRRGRHAVDMLALTVWTVVFGIGWVIRFPLACWCFIELVRIPFGHSAWYFAAWFAALVAIYLLPVLYTPRELR